ncbi:precorrin-3B C(17)-methyltransferase [Halostreptopolyspora alba]|uniref:Precorrin-3B C(17)-methyltransferase n=1 Tax=Halostreptopolyspora alba TaxID=2487137 RepID=A0A3N0EHF0_9ACTN|nr:precorrin-3B C(17)-methyltransferase [Nocardiopsaceae bacterium YIM 96095]
MSGIGVIAVTARGRAAAERLVEAWPDEARPVGADRPADALRAAFTECAAVVSFLAVGATVRVLAPLLGDKTDDTPVVCVDEGTRHAVAVLGGHHGANDLAHRVSEVLGSHPVVTTASDTVSVTPLDSYGHDLGFTLADRGPLATVGAAVLSGDPVRVEGAGEWPLPPLPGNADPSVPTGRASAVIRVSDRTGDGAEPGVPTLTYRPPSVVVGVGSARGAGADEVGRLVDRTLAEAGVAPDSVRGIATVDIKADEEGILAAARERGWEVTCYPAADLNEVRVPNPSETVRAEVGTPSVAEAAALRCAAEAGRGLGAGAELVAAKRKSGNATAAVARLRPRGRLAVVGLGPGARDQATPRAVAELRRASVVVGLDQYLDQVRDLLRPGTRVVVSGLGQEEERARTAVEEARTGAAVALVGSGDAGVYAMASPALDFAGADIDVVGVPGITAAVAASNLLGAPLGHDHAYVSLSDLHTPWEAIERRVRAVAEGDFTVCFYNPRSKKRDWQLTRALEILAEHRPSDTPVGHVRQVSREGERATMSTIQEMLAGGVEEVDMFTVVIVGSSASRTVAGRFVTPRGYRWRG